MRIVRETITPSAAKVILQTKNNHNRNLNQKTVSALARAITEGRWRVTHQGIAFYDDGTLADGQHRLAAVAQSGVPIEVMVTYGASKDTAMMVDTGRARNTSDVIKISGQADWITKKMLPTIPIAFVVDKTSAEEMVILAEHIKDSLLFMDQVFYKNIKGASAPLRAAITLAHYHGEDELRLMEFVEMFYSGFINNEEDTAVIRLRDYLMTAQHSRGSTERILDLNRCQNAIKKFCKHEPMKALRVLSSLPYPRLKVDGIIKTDGVLI